MRKVLGRMVRRYLEVTSRSLRTFDQDRPLDLGRPSRPGRLLASAAPDDETPIDLREAQPRDEEPVVELDTEVISLDDPARREQ